VSKNIFAAAAISAVALATSVPAHAVVVVDGVASDWNVTFHNDHDSGSGLPAYAGPGTFGLLGGLNPAVEDSDNTAGTGAQVGPWQGGQKYDAEYMAVALSTPIGGSLSNSSIYILIVSGQRPDNGTTEFGLGDVRIDAATGHYGIETGGGAAHNGGTPVGVQTQSSSAYNYGLDGNGFTTSSNVIGGVTAGTIYKTSNAVAVDRDTSNWLLDPLINDNGSPSAPPPSEQDDRNQLNYTNLTNADKVNANMVYRYSADALCGDGTLASDHVGNSCAANGGASVHSVIEMSFDAAPFVTTDGNGDESLVFSVEWGPACNNDVLEVQLAATSEHSRVNTPEPATLALFGLGLGVLGFRARRKRTA
jgi:hypothetical protein